MAAALYPVLVRYTFAMRFRGKMPDVACFACGQSLKSNATVEEGAGRHRCTAKADGRNTNACGALYWIVAGVKWPWGAGGAFIARTTEPELSQLDAAGLSVQQKVQHFLHTPYPGDR